MSGQTTYEGSSGITYDSYSTVSPVSDTKSEYSYFQYHCNPTTFTVIQTKKKLFASVQSDEEQNTRVSLDTHLLRIRNNGTAEFTEKQLVTKSRASIIMSTVPEYLALVYISDAMVDAEFKKVISDQLKNSYLVPLNTAIKESTNCNPC